MPSQSLDSLSISAALAYQVQEVRGEEGRVRQRFVILQHPDALAELFRTQFSAVLYPDYESASLSELLREVLPALHRRFNTPEQWRSRQLLTAPAKQVAETLSHRLRADPELRLPGTFSIPVVADDPLLLAMTPEPSRPTTLSRWWSRLFPPRAPALPEQVQPQPALGTQAELLASPTVRKLQLELQANLQKAQQSEDALWRYNAKSALLEYLPETVRLHGERFGSPDDPGFLQALANLQAIATSGAQANELRWQAHQRFLDEKARELS